MADLETTNCTLFETKKKMCFYDTFTPKCVKDNDNPQGQ